MKSLNAILKKEIFEHFEQTNIQWTGFVKYRKSMSLTDALDLSIGLDKNKTLDIVKKSVGLFEKQKCH